MQKPRLDLNDLEVSSFATVAPQEPTLGPIVIPNPNDPTAATWCYICPVRTQGCY